ncbi:RAM signaling network component, partial [Cryomyces antarcticus]
LTEEKRESRAPDVAIRAGKSILYSIFQIYRPLRDLIKLVRDVERKRSRLECLFFSACSHLEELDRQLANIESLTDDDGNAKKRLSTHSVMSSCLTCIQAHDKMSTELRVHVRHIIHRGEP